MGHWITLKQVNLRIFEKRKDKAQTKKQNISIDKVQQRACLSISDKSKTLWQSLHLASFSFFDSSNQVLNLVSSNQFELKTVCFFILFSYWKIKKMN